MRMSQPENRYGSQCRTSTSCSGERSTFQLRLCLSRGFRSAGSRPSVYAETVSALFARTGRNVGGSTNFPGSCAGQFGAKRRVVLSLPFFVPAIFATAHTDLILTVPRKLAQMTAPIARMRVVEPPREIKTFPYFMAWHPRLTTEPAHTWFREQLRMAAR